jgi:hypothetical protein
MPRSNSDNFGDIAATPPSPTPIPSENAQLRRRNLNSTGLPDGIRDNERQVEYKAMNGDHDDGDTIDKEQGSDDSGEKKDGDKEMSREEGISLGQRLRSPLGSTLNLEELRSQISQGVEVK